MAMPRSGSMAGTIAAQLWRPSGEVLHLLTERRHPANDLDDNHSGAANHSSSSIVVEEEPAAASKRQAPAVWKPPIGMKPNCPLAPAAVVDEWQLPKQQEEEQELRSSGGGDCYREQENNDPQSLGSDLATLPPGSCSSSGNARSLDAAKNDFSATTTDEDLMPAPRTSSGFIPDSGKLFHASSPSLFSTGGSDAKLPSPFLKPQVVAQTPLFSGLGSVSFGSGTGFLQPSTGSIFAQSLPLGFGRSLRDDEPQQQQQQQQIHVAQFSSIKLLSSTNSASDKGSSDSQAGRAAGVAIDSNGGFKPSGLSGKSLVPDQAPAKTAKSNVSSGRKLRTRPLDLLMNAPVVEVPGKSTRVSARISNANANANPSGAQLNSMSSARDDGAATPIKPGSVKNSQASASRAPRPTRSSARQENLHNLQKQEQEDAQEQQEQQEQQQEQRRGAFFAHTGAWIVQRKSSRQTKRRKSQNLVEEPKRDKVPAPKQLPAKNRNGQHQHETTSRPTLTKKRSLTAISTPPQPEPKQQKRKQSKVGARNGHKAQDRDNIRDDEQDGDEDEDDDSKVVTKAPLVQSKRGRPRSLPSKLRDSVVVNKVAKTSKRDVK